MQTSQYLKETQLFDLSPVTALLFEDRSEKLFQTDSEGSLIEIRYMLHHDTEDFVFVDHGDQRLGSPLPAHVSSERRTASEKHQYQGEKPPEYFILRQLYHESVSCRKHLEQVERVSMLEAQQISLITIS